MVLPLISAGLSLAGGISGLLSDRAKNKRSKEQLELDRMLANKQISIADYMQELSRGVMDRGSGVTDPYGNTTGYDEATGSYTSPMRPAERQLQDASDAEELSRYTVDQEMRRRALQEAEGRRGRAGVEADQAMRDMSLFKQGVGAVDPTQISRSIRLNREGAINAGFDDAERAATTLGLRTGSSATGAALGRLAQDRVRARAQIGNPELEGVEFADNINAGRQGRLGTIYNMFNTNANNVYDAAFNPSTVADKSFEKSMAVQGADLSRANTALGGSAAAISGLGSAAAGQRQGYAATEANRVHAPFGQFLGGLGAMAKGMNFGNIFGG